MGAKFSSGGGATVFYDKTDTPGEIVTELVNASDGAGLHFDGAGQVTATALDMPAPYSFEVIFKADNVTELQVLIGNGSGTARRALTIAQGKLIVTYYEGGSWQNATGGSIEVGKVYHAVGTRDASGLQKVYLNGNDVTSGSSPEGYYHSNRTIGSNGNSGTYFNGTIFRARIWNKALSSSEVQTAYERADVDFADQYGSQTEKVANGGLENWNVANTVPDDWPVVTAGSSTVARSSDAASGSYSAQLSIDSNNSNVYINTSAVTLPAGKTVRYSVQMKGSAAIDGVAIYALGDNVTIDSPAVTTSYQTFTGTYTATADSRLLIGRLSTGNGNSKSIFVDNASVVQIGCVSDYDLAFANPTQSRMVQDRSGAADGTASTSGVTQVQPVVQLNATAARIGTSAATPADGDIVADKIGVGVAPSTLADFKASSANGAKIKLINSDYNNTNEFTAGIGNLDIYANTTTVLGAQYRYLRLGVGTTEGLRIDSTGLATFNNGIAFQSATTGSGTGVGYTLENYEYGTFTMGLSGTTATISSDNELARYYRIGNLVWISWYSGSMGLTSSAGSAMLTGLPFTVADNNKVFSVFSYNHGNAVDGSSRGGYFDRNTTTMRFIDNGATTAASFIDGSGRYIMVTGVYETDDA